MNYLVELFGRMEVDLERTESIRDVPVECSKVIGNSETHSLRRKKNGISRKLKKGTEFATFGHGVYIKVSG